MIRNLLTFRPILRLFYLKAEIDRLLFLSVCFSMGLLAARIVVTHSLTSASLAWNLFLAFIPYGISKWLYGNTAFIRSKWILAGIFICWLLFIPNSFYIITDLFHLQENRNAPLWFDLLLIFSFAWNGLLVGVLSVRQMEHISRLFFRLRHDIVFLYPVMWLNAFGIFIGRYLRYNSWDVITNPFSLIKDMINLIFHPLLYKNEWAMIVCFSIFMTLLYLTIRKISRMIW